MTKTKIKIYKNYIDIKKIKMTELPKCQVK